jgi:hypothetical protein
MNKRIFTFSGEFVRRAEFTAIENLEEVKERLLSFAQVDAVNKKEYDFRPFSVLLGNKGISFKDVALNFKSILLPYDGVVITPNDLVPPEEEFEKEYFSFGNDHLALWGGRENVISDKVSWLEFVQLRNADVANDFKDSSQLEDLSQVVCLLGVKHGLLLVDLDARKITDCSNFKEIYEYFKNW